jgi:glycosyltransferase involved in cell wall biosynthesis
MEKLCAAYRVRSFFEFMGWRKHEELPALYAEADVVVKPSLMEGFGLIFLEAMRAGVPVIGGNVGGTPELIQDGYNGFLVNPNDVTSLHQKLSALLCDKHLYHQVRMNGFKTAQRFTRNRMVEDTIRCYQDVREGKIPR